MKKTLRSLLILLLFLPLFACAGRAPTVKQNAAPQVKIPDEQAALRSPLAGLQFEPVKFEVPEVDRVQLPNGIHLYLREDHELPLVAVTAMAEAGSISVPAEQTGLAELMAALLRTGGAGKRTPVEVDEALAMMAADLSVSTETYTTNFNLSVQSKDIDAGMAILADMIRRPKFDPQRLELARKQAIEGIRRQYDEPDAIASRAVMRAIYGDNPLGRFPTEQTIAAIDREDLLQFHRKYFYPNNLWMAISGDFDRQQLMTLLERLFGDWETGEVARQTIPPVEPNPQPLVLVAPKDIPQTTVLIGELGIDKDSPDLFSVKVMNFILGGGGFNSRLMREIRSNRGLAYSVYSYFQVGRRLPGPFIAGTETKTSSTMEVVKLMREIIAEMRSQPVSDQELDLAKESLINSFIFAFTDSHDIVTQQMTLDYFDYPPDYLSTYRDKVAAVSAEDVLQAARKHLDPAVQKIVLVGNVSEFGGDPASLGPPVKRVGKTGEFR